MSIWYDYETLRLFVTQLYVKKCIGGKNEDFGKNSSCIWRTN